MNMDRGKQYNKVKPKIDQTKRERERERERERKRLIGKKTQSGVAPEAHRSAQASLLRAGVATCDAAEAS